MHARNGNLRELHLSVWNSELHWTKRERFLKGSPAAPFLMMLLIRETHQSLCVWDTKMITVPPSRGSKSRETGGQILTDISICQICTLCNVSAVPWKSSPLVFPPHLNQSKKVKPLAVILGVPKGSGTIVLYVSSQKESVRSKVIAKKRFIRIGYLWGLQMGRWGGSATWELSGLQFCNQRKPGEGEKSLFLSRCCASVINPSSGLSRAVFLSLPSQRGCPGDH